MQHITWYRLLAVGVLAAPIVAGAQAPNAQVPAAKVREVATIEGDVNGFVRLPSGRALIYSVDDSTFTYDVITKRRTLLGTNMHPGSVSPQSDRLAFSRSSENPRGIFLWTMPIDLKTGIATGQAQRVSLRSGGRGMFSPDAKMLVRGAVGPDGTWDVTLVPAMGGAERVVANYLAERGPPAVGWSADGQSLYVELGGETVIERVPLAGGPSEPLVPRTGITDCFAVGLTPDARVAFFECNPDRFFYHTASGLEGEISVALPPLDDGWGYDLSLDSTRYTAIIKVWNQGVRVLELATGQARDLLPGNVQSSAPAWSPDGRRLAVLRGNSSHYDIAVMNADGSSPRRYPVPMHVNGWGAAWEMPWSPDGRFLAFRAHDRPTIGWSHDQSQLALLDVNSGQTRFLTTSSATIGGFMWRSDGKNIDKFVWRSDGKAIRALKRTLVPMGGYSPRRWSIVEIELNGTERLLRDISAEFPNANNVVFTYDSTVVVTVTAEKMTERFLVPLDGGAARRLPDPAIELGSRVGGTLVAGNRLLIGQVDARGESRAITILSTVGDSTRTLRLPFSSSYSAVLPDGKQIVSVGKVTGDSVYKLFLVPLDGSATRLIGVIPRGTSFAAVTGSLLAPSPNGKLLAYTSDGRPPTSKILEVDFGPALQAIMKR
jgi:Tol biopolymer transport system component